MHVSADFARADPPECSRSFVTRLPDGSDVALFILAPWHRTEAGVIPADAFVQAEESCRRFSAPAFGAHRMAQAVEVEQHRDLAAGRGGEFLGMVDKGVGQAFAIGRVGDDVAGTRCGLAQEVDAGFPPAASTTLPRRIF